MIKFLAFLLILCIMFGVEATRSFIFGTFGFIFWTIAILAGIGLLIDLFKDKRTPEQKEADEKKKKEAELAAKGDKRSNTIAYIILVLFIITCFVFVFAFGRLK